MVTILVTASGLATPILVTLDCFEDEMIRTLRQTTFSWTAASSLTIVRCGRPAKK